MIEEFDTHLDVRKELRAVILAAPGVLDALGGNSSRVVYGARDQVLPKPSISIFGLSESSADEVDTHDEDEQYHVEQFQLSITGKLPSDTTRLYGLISRYVNNKERGMFFRVKIRRRTEFTEPDENSHYLVSEVEVSYRMQQ